MNENNAIQALVNAGADAQTNMYDIEMEFADWNVTARAEGIDIPEIEAQVYENAYHGVKYPRIKSEQNFTRKFSVTFRMDARYNLYESFTSLLSYHVDPTTGGVSNSNVDKVGTVKIKTLDNPFIAHADDSNLGSTIKHLGHKDYNSEGTVKTFGAIKEGKTWEFYNVFVTKVGMPKFKTESADKVSFTVDFHFGQCKYPGFAKAK